MESPNDNNTTDIASINNRVSMRGTSLNRLCFSLGDAENSKKFKAFPEAYCHSYNLTREEIHAVTDLDILSLIKLGAKYEFLENLTSLYGMVLADVIAQQTSLTDAEFKEITGSDRAG